MKSWKIALARKKGEKGTLVHTTHQLKNGSACVGEYQPLP